MSKLKALYYVNQFYAGIGGEDKADIGLVEFDEKKGPAIGVEGFWQGEMEVVKTIACGDNFINDEGNFQSLIPELRRIIKEAEPDVVIAGPAFNAGRYGSACGKIIEFAKKEFDIPAVTGMYKENPALPMYLNENYIVKTDDAAAGMKKALPYIANLSLKLAKGEIIGPARKEGYFPRGYRYNEWHEKTGAERVVDILIKKLKREPYETEVPLRKFERVSPAESLDSLANKKIAFITTGGLVPKGNPDRLKQAFSTTYARYSIENKAFLEEGEYESIHGGFDTTKINEDPNRLFPLKELRKLDEEGYIGEIHPQFLTLSGIGTNIESSRKIGEEMVKEVKEAGVDGVILTST